jgi:diamine N-acetyltransferase
MPELTNAALEDIPTIQQLAEKTWWPTYSAILPSEQLAYMLNAIYNAEALAKVMQDKSQIFVLLKDQDSIVGFAAYGPKESEPATFKLHKLYVLPGMHGKGYGKLLIDEVRNRAAKSGIKQLDLNVNRFNPAKNFYEKLGFRIIKEEDVPVGPYWMNDYVMRLSLTPE